VPFNRFVPSGITRPPTARATFRVPDRGRPQRRRGARFRSGLLATAEAADAAPATALRPKGAVLREAAALPRLSELSSPGGAGEAAAFVLAAFGVSAGAGADQAAGDRESPASPGRTPGLSNEQCRRLESGHRRLLHLARPEAVVRLTWIWGDEQGRVSLSTGDLRPSCCEFAAGARAIASVAKVWPARGRRCDGSDRARRGRVGVVQPLVSPREAAVRCPTEAVARPVTSASRGPACGSSGRCSRPPHASRRVVLVRTASEVAAAEHAGVRVREQAVALPLARSHRRS
jgi:hypothetical protein